MMFRMIAGLSLALLTWQAPADERLAHVTLEQLQTAAMPRNVRIETGVTDGEPWARITNEGDSATAVQLAEIPNGTLKDTRITYDAELSCENMTSPAYLELWAVVGGEAYFSRALNDTFLGTQGPRHSSTSFILKADSVLESARLGVRFEGPGTVTIRNIELWERPGARSLSRMGGLIGAAIGILSAIWGSVTSYCVSRGRARNTILGFTAAFAMGGLIAFIAGVAAWTQGAPWDVWYTFVLLGAIVGAVYCTLYVTLRARYQQSEERRMAALDLR